MTAPQLADTEMQQRIEQLARPMMDYLMQMQPKDAVYVLTLAVATVLTHVQHKDGKTPLDTYNDHFDPAVRKTIESELEFRKSGGLQ